jgi:hypothetical protein
VRRLQNHDHSVEHQRHDDGGEFAENFQRESLHHVACDLLISPVATACLRRWHISSLDGQVMHDTDDDVADSIMPVRRTIVRSDATSAAFSAINAVAM